MKNNKVYITGIGSISALGYDNTQVWENISNNDQTISVKTDWKDEKIKPTLYGKTPEIDFKEEVQWKERMVPNTYSTLGILACKKAIEDADLKLEDQDNEVGVIIESCLAATESVEDYLHDLFLKGVHRVRPLKFTKTVANTVLGDVSRFFRLNGPSSLLYNENSINYGYDLIQKGVADIVICGGVDHYTEFRVLCEQEQNNLIPGDQPSNLQDLIAKTKDTNQNILGDGAAFVVLESEKSVNNRKANTYAELVDYHSNFDYENVDTTSKRQEYILDDAYEHFKKDIKEDSNVAFLSAYTTPVQTQTNEKPVLDKLEENNALQVLNHKAHTGDMKSASTVMGVYISSQILKKNKFPKSEDASGVDYAFVSTNHEGGTSSHFLLKQSNN